jgi:hypothetical protein
MILHLKSFAAQCSNPNGCNREGTIIVVAPDDEIVRQH